MLGFLIPFVFKPKSRYALQARIKLSVPPEVIWMSKNVIVWLFSMLLILKLTTNYKALHVVTVFK